MRILAIRARNLASLPRFDVDLTQGALGKTRIFAITGPTGAGKSTLLDALCVALYDRAPRLGGPRDVPIGELEVNASDPRSLMRRGATEASSEVDFLARDQKRYRATWDVWRARKKHDGKIQSQRMRLVRLDDPKDLTGATKTETLATIEHLVGLSYDEFRRAVLLAQGDFASFLKAKTDERAELLEKMTGTELYAEISKGAFLRAKREDEALLGLEARLGSFRALPDEERKMLEDQMQTLAAKKRALEIEAEDARQRARREESILDLCTEIEAKSLELGRAQDAWNESAQVREELSNTREAERMRGAFESSVRAEDAAEKAIARAQQADAAHARSEAERNESKAFAEEALRALEDAKRSADELAPKIESAKRLDVQAEEARRRLEEASREEELRSKAERRAESDREALLNAIETSEAKLRAAAAWLSDHRHLLALAVQWPRWREGLERYRALLFAHGGRVKDKARAERALKDAETAEARAQEALLRTEKAARLLFEKAAQHRSALESHRQKENRTEMRQAVERIAREIGALESMRALVKETRRAQRELAEKLELKKTEHEAAALRQREAAALLAKIADLDQAQKKAALEKRRADWREELFQRRAELLQPGEPCPLCGSHNHPHQDGAPKAPSTPALTGMLDRLELELGRARAALKSAQEAGSAHALGEKTAEELAERLRLENERREAEWKRRLEALEMIWVDAPRLAKKGVARAAMAIASVPSAKNADSSVARTIEVFAAERDSAKAWLDEDEALQKGLDDARQAAERAEEDLRAASKLVERVRARASEETHKLQVIESALVRDRALLEESEQDLSQAFPDPGWTSDLAKDPAGFIETAGAQVAAYEAAQKTQTDVEIELRNLAEAKTRADAELRLRLEDLRRARSEREAVKKRADEIGEERKKLLDGRRVEDVLEQIARVEKSARLRAEAALDRQRKAGEAWAASDAQAKAAHHQREEAEAGQATLRLRLELELRASKIGDRALLARLLELGPEWIRRAEAEIEAKKDALTRLTSALEDREKQLFAKTGGEKRSRSEAEAHTSEARRQKQQAEERLVQAIEAEARVKGQLGADDQTRAEIALLRPEIEKQRATCDRWAEMAALIGSADGKKLRTFAQGLTLDALIAQANLHLEQLRPRYRLERVPGFDMELEVVDGDMGDEVRAIATLSGGETFLVSLALALGLSSLSAKNVSIRSLFIDEGFGSLDKEALEAALATLDQLQAGGRTIGLISHMPDVAERIGYQIHVRPTGPGRSEVIVLA